MFKKSLSLTVITCFFLNTLGPIPKAHADNLGLPEPGTMVNLSPAYEPVMIKGLTVHKDNPFLFDFIVDVGQDKMSGEPLKKEGEKLIKYFLASLAIPDKDVWVNLSPYEKNRMIPEALGQTDMGRDLLEQDYILKQITASLIYPEKQLGKTFWEKVYAKSQQMYGTTQIPVNTFNKVWIMADRAEVFEHNQTAFVVDSHLKVMLEEDYLALTKHQANPQTHSIASNIVKQIILPELEKEVNTGKNFANLRQIFNSIILSSWYKRNLKQALLNQVYANQSKVKGINLNDPTIKEQIYQQYLKAYKKGVFNYIKEDMVNGENMPRKYFSGGMAIVNTPAAEPAMTTDPVKLDYAMQSTTTLVDFNTGVTNSNMATRSYDLSKALKELKVVYQEILEISDDLITQDKGFLGSKDEDILDYLKSKYEEALTLKDAVAILDITTVFKNKLSKLEKRWLIVQWNSLSNHELSVPPTIGRKAILDLKRTYPTRQFEPEEEYRIDRVLRESRRKIDAAMTVNAAVKQMALIQEGQLLAHGRLSIIAYIALLQRDDKGSIPADINNAFNQMVTKLREAATWVKFIEASDLKQYGVKAARLGKYLMSMKASFDSSSPLTQTDALQLKFCFLFASGKTSQISTAKLLDNMGLHIRYRVRTWGELFIYLANIVSVRDDVLISIRQANAAMAVPAAMRVVNVSQDFQPMTSMKLDVLDHREISSTSGGYWNISETPLVLADSATHDQLQTLVKLTSLDEINFKEAKLLFASDGENTNGMAIGLFDGRFLRGAILLNSSDWLVQEYATFKSMAVSTVPMVRLNGVTPGVDARDETLTLTPDAAMMTNVGRAADGKGAWVEIYTNSSDVSERVAQRMAEVLEQNNKKGLYTLFILPTGNTAIPIHDTFARIVNEKNIDCSKLMTANMDEYGKSKKYREFMEKNLFSKIRSQGFDDKNVLFFNGHAANPKAELKRYNRILEEMKAKAGGVIALEVGGIGVKAHVAFNEAPKVVAADVDFQKLLQELPFDWWEKNEFELVSTDNIETQMDNVLRLRQKGRKNLVDFIYSKIHDEYPDITKKQIAILVQEIKKQTVTFRIRGLQENTVSQDILRSLTQKYGHPIEVVDAEEIKKAKSRVVELSISTLIANISDFADDLTKMSTWAYTIGLGTVVSAKEILIAATGPKKAGAIGVSTQKVNPEAPASILSDHPNARFIIDQEAASALDIRMLDEKDQVYQEVLATAGEFVKSKIDDATHSLSNKLNNMTVQAHLIANKDETVINELKNEAYKQALYVKSDGTTSNVSKQDLTRAIMDGSHASLIDLEIFYGKYHYVLLLGLEYPVLFKMDAAMTTAKAIDYYLKHKLKPEDWFRGATTTILSTESDRNIILRTLVPIVELPIFLVQQNDIKGQINGKEAFQLIANSAGPWQLLKLVKELNSIEYVLIDKSEKPVSAKFLEFKIKKPRQARKSKVVQAQPVILAPAPIVKEVNVIPLVKVFASKQDFIDGVNKNILKGQADVRLGILSIISVMFSRDGQLNSSTNELLAASLIRNYRIKSIKDGMNFDQELFQLMAISFGDKDTRKLIEGIYRQLLKSGKITKNEDLEQFFTNDETYRKVEQKYEDQVELLNYIEAVREYGNLSAKKDISEYQIFFDAAMAVNNPGGIDLNTSNGMQWKVSKDGKGVEMNIDPAMMARIKREGIDSLSPVIFKITPIVSIWPLVGLQAPAAEEHLAKV